MVKISFENESRKDINKWCWKHLGAEIKAGGQFTLTAKDQISTYLYGNRKKLDFSIIHINSHFHKNILKEERKIPYGETRSYKDMAVILGNPSLARVVGAANANNPLPLYFPCHRIINSNGKLGGFSGGIKVKEFLLKIEQ